MRGPLADALVEHETRTPVLSPLVVQLSNQVHNVEVRHSERQHGTSTITFRESIDRVVRTSFTARRCRCASSPDWAPRPRS